MSTCKHCGTRMDHGNVLSFCSRDDVGGPYLHAWTEPALPEPPASEGCNGTHYHVCPGPSCNRLDNAVSEGDDTGPVSADEPDTAGVVTERDAEAMTLALFGPDTTMLLPTDSATRKAMPLFNGLIKYFPRALCAIACLSFEANEKHNPGEPLHWSKNKSSDHLDALVRHLFDSGCIDPEFGFLHDVGLAWRALANLETKLEAQETK